ncbi:hypothetical protein [Myxococcus sp. AS-1-15]|uniref:hypothetical protein n=1 Tax=Myxococcus sp. AS-1-15 TaxID=2874600 RepID=UPI001CC0D978|nr:hypothetical protein [Myxococcus sp. AS-1-15]MBZ4402416.1 hypothetical protein [Myxococcus sp. AS-1-15]
MAVQYDPNIIQAHAEALYAQAKGLVVRSAFAGFAFGALIGFVTGGKDSGPILAVVGGVVLAIIGVSMARSRAFALQLQAQSALCNVAIEANTRRAADAALAAARPATDAQRSQVG